MNKITKWLILGVVFALVLSFIVTSIGYSIGLIVKLTLLLIVIFGLYKIYTSPTFKNLLVKFKIKKK